MASDARFIGPVDRLLYLRATEAFAAMSADDLYAIAQSVEERSFRKGSVLLREGELADRFFLLVEGKVSLRRGGRAYRVLEAPGAAGLLAALSEHPSGVEARAEEDTLTLQLRIDDFWNALEDSFDLLLSLINELTRQMAELQRELERNGLLAREEPVDTPYPERPLDLVQRLVTIRRGGPFRNASLNPLTEIAERATEVRVEPGTVLWREGEISTYGLNIVHGIVRCTGDDGRRQFRMGPGSVLGTLETLARLPRSYEAVAETRLIALRGNVEVLLDMLEDNFELGRAFTAFLANGLDKLYERAALLRMRPG